MALATKHSVALRHGVEMPLVGLGTSHDGGFSHEAIVHAFKIGYRFIREDVKSNANVMVNLTENILKKNYQYVFLYEMVK